jgi:hypothetical protein
VVDDHCIPDGNVIYSITDRVNDTCHIAAANMEVIGFTHFLADMDHIYRDALCGPDVIVVNPSRHSAD